MMNRRQVSCFPIITVWSIAPKLELALTSPVASAITSQPTPAHHKLKDKQNPFNVVNYSLAKNLRVTTIDRR